MTPDQARTVANAVGQQLQHEWMTTYKVLAAVPNEKRDYKPEPNARSAWELATHMAGADVWFLDGVLNGKFDASQTRKRRRRTSRAWRTGTRRSSPTASSACWRCRTTS